MWTPDILVLSSGGINGVKSFLYLGALCYLSDKNILSSINTFLGVSIGCFISALLTADYSPRQIISILVDNNLLKQYSSDEYRNVNTRMAINNITSKLNELLLAKFGTVPTLHQLYLATNKTLICTVFNMSQNKCEYLSHYTYPGLSVSDAVSISMNLPILSYQNIMNGMIYIDAAIYNPLPIGYFIEEFENIDMLKILTLFIHTNYKNSNNIYENDSIKYRIIDSSIQYNIYQTINRYNFENIFNIPLETDIIDSTIELISIANKAEMVVSGYETVRKSFS